MFGVRRLFAPRRVLIVGAIGFCGWSAFAPRAARADAPRYPDIFPLSKVKPGMKGYGLTTFRGTTISRFDVTVVGILKKENNGRDLILIKMKGGPITERKANLIQGMSGSPIYLNGKVVGAFSMGEQFPNEPVGMVTPIEDMLEAWDPNIPQQPTYFQPAEKNAPKAAGQSKNTVGMRWHPDNGPRVVTLAQPIDVDGRHLSKLVLNARADETRRSTPATAVLYRATTLLSVTGLRDKDRDWLQKELDKRGYAVTVAAGPGVGRSAKFKGVPLRPGSAFGTFLATGDLQVGGTGTVTYRRGSRMLGFGHPLFGLGAIEAAITSASIVDIFSSLRVSHHIAIAGPIIGTLQQDRDFSVSADLNRMPHMIPFDVIVRDQTNKRTETFRTQVFQHPDLSGLLLRLIARQAVSQVHSIPGDVMARVTTSVDADEVGKVTRSSIVYDANDISTPVTQDLGDITNIVSGNPFYPLPIKSARMTVDIMSGHNTATVERIFLKQGRYEPGDSLDIGVVLKPYRRDAVTRTLSLKLPSDLPTGRYQLTVRGGTQQVMRIGPFVIGGAQEPQTPPANIHQMVARLNEREGNTDLLARLTLNSIAPALEGEKLSQLPPNLNALMRSDRNSGVRLERDELRTTAPTDYVVSGAQQLLVTIVHKNSQEPTGNGTYNNVPASGTTGSPSLTIQGSSPSGASADDSSLGSENEDNPEHSEGNTDNARTISPQLNDPARLWLSDVDTPQNKPDNKPKADDKKKKDSKKSAAKTDKADAKTSEDTPSATTASPAATPNPAPPADASNDKPVGRQLQVWRQTARGDFANGKFEGTSITATGELRLTPTLRRLASSTETYIWSLAADDQGNLYAGTGTSGKILKIDPQGKIHAFATLPVVAVQSLLRSKSGALYAGSGVKGNLYRISGEGEPVLLGSLPEKYIIALAEDSKGNLYAAPGGGGTVYKIKAEDLTKDGKTAVTPVPYLKTPADHIMAMAIDGQDNLYVGTGNDGIIYRVTSDGMSSVLYDAKENAITALAPDKNGNLYVGTGPKGILYRIAPDGTATVVYDRATSFYTAIKAAPDGSFYATTVNAVYHIQPVTQGDALSETVVALDNPKDVDFLSLTLLPDGSVATGTGNIGEVYVAAPDTAGNTPHMGTYESVVHDAKLLSRWGAARWDGAFAGGHVRVETRTGNVAEPDSTWSAWSPVRTSGSALEGTITSPPARFIQYRLTLESDHGSASNKSLGVREITLGYMPRNQAPRVNFLAPVGGERWARTQTIRWNAVDPDNDTLTYELTISNDGGATWMPLPTTATGSKPSSTSAVSSSDREAALERIKKELDARGIPEAMKQVVLDGFRKRSESAAILRETSKALDTKLLPDGVYTLKVVASDRISNPMDAQTTQLVSEPFVVCNTPPQVKLSAPQTLGEGGSVTLEGTVTQNLVAVTAVQYRVDGGDWIAAVAKDGLFDSSQEGFTVVTLPLPKGKHTLEVAAFNTAGSKSIEKTTVDIP